MSEYIDSVKEAMRLIRKSADALKVRQPDLATERSFLVGNLENTVGHILHLEGLTTALSPEIGNINDLPEELRKELSVAKTDDLEDQIVTVINAYGGEASLDQVLVGLFRKFEMIQKRKFLMNKLYRMSMVWSIPGRKGIYTTTEPPEQEETGGFGTNTASDMDDEIPF